MSVRRKFSLLVSMSLTIGMLSGVGPAVAAVESIEDACVGVELGGVRSNMTWCVDDGNVLHLGPGKLDNFFLKDDGQGNAIPDLPWSAKHKVLTKVIFHGTQNNPTQAGTNMRGLFMNALRLTEIVNAEAFDVSETLYLPTLFAKTPMLQSVDVSKWDTSKVQEMDFMFDGASALKTVDVSKWDTSQVTRMEYMFRGAKSLKTLDVSKWDLSGGPTLNHMFWGASSLEKLDVSKWDVSKVRRMDSIFREATSLKHLDLSGWDMTKTFATGWMFDSMSSLQSLRLGPKSALHGDCHLMAPGQPKYTGNWVRADAGGKPIKGSETFTNQELINYSWTGKAAGLYVPEPNNATVPPLKPGPTPPIAQGPKLAGVDRFETAVVISRQTFAPGVPVVFVASGMTFPDALGAAAVAGSVNSPVLLVPRDGTVPDAVKTELQRLTPGRIIVVGGENTISSGVKAELGSYTTGEVERVFGFDRFATSAKISARSFAPGVEAVYVADGLDFPDALAASAPAGDLEGPVLLVKPNQVSAEVKEELRRLKPKRIVVAGGTNSVSASVMDEVAAFASQGATRHSGANRFETAAQISAKYFGQGVPVAYVASGLDFPDALTAGAVAGAQSGPVLLATRDTTPQSIKTELSRLKPKRIVIIGGKNSISDAVLREVGKYQAGR